MVETIPGVSGGRPVLRGSGFSIAQLAACHRAGWSVDEIIEHYPQLDAIHVYAGLAYYYAHKDAIDAELARQQDAYDKGKARQSRRASA